MSTDLRQTDSFFTLFVFQWSYDLGIYLIGLDNKTTTPIWEYYAFLKHFKALENVYSKTGVVYEVFHEFRGRRGQGNCCKM